jgi:ubiquinone/menaquinone biosynthesis C-methylase UbiE
MVIATLTKKSIDLKSLIRAHYNSIATTWHNKVWVHDPDFKNSIKSFANLTGEEKLLDVGIGSGDFCSLFKVASVTGIDISERHLDECRTRHPDYRLFLGDAENMPFSSDVFDVVCCRNLLQHFKDPTRVLKEMLRATKPNGMVLIVESAVYDQERTFPTTVCRVVEPFHPLFPSHESLQRLITPHSGRNFEQIVAGVHKKWVGKWQKSKGATERQRRQIYQICKSYPDWYKEKYRFSFFPGELEVESTLTFSLIKFSKAAS